MPPLNHMLCFRNDSFAALQVFVLAFLKTLGRQRTDEKWGILGAQVFLIRPYMRRCSHIIIWPFSDHVIKISDIICFCLICSVTAIPSYISVSLLFSIHPLCRFLNVLFLFLRVFMCVLRPVLSETGWRLVYDENKMDENTRGWTASMVAQNMRVTSPSLGVPLTPCCVCVCQYCVSFYTSPRFACLFGRLLYNTEANQLWFPWPSSLSRWPRLHKIFMLSPAPQHSSSALHIYEAGRLPLVLGRFEILVAGKIYARFILLVAAERARQWCSRSSAG